MECIYSATYSIIKPSEKCTGDAAHVDMSGIWLASGGDSIWPDVQVKQVACPLGVVLALALHWW